MKKQIHAPVLHFLGAVEKFLTRLSLGSLTLFAAAIAIAPPMVCADEQAKMADAFVDSIAVNTHFLYGNSPYVTNLSGVIGALEVSGIRHLRDGSTASSSAMSQVVSQVRADTGRRIGFNLVTETGCTINTNTVNPAENLNWTGYTNIDSIEGMNELNTYSCTSPPWYVEDKNDLAALYHAIQTNINMSGVYVLGPSVVVYYGSQGYADATSVGDCTAIMNYGVQHSYPNALMPSTGILMNLTNLVPMNGNLPVMATETGYHNDTLEHGANNQIGVSEQAGGKYYSRLYFEYLNAGIVRAYAYELVDDTAFLNYGIDTNGGAEAHFGLLHPDASPKPAFTAITNEVALLSDPGSPFTPGTLNYNLGSAPTNLVHHTLLEKRTGTFYLALWQETNSYNTSTFTNNVVNPLSVTVTFSNTMATVNQYNPLSSPNAFATSNNVSSLTVSVLDQALILEIVPQVSGPPPAPTGLTATPGNGQVFLNWELSPGATNYNVYRSTTNGGPYTKIASGVSSTSYTDSGLNNGTTYYYVVTAVNGYGESGYSSQASATPCAFPAAPTGLTATGGNAQVALSWTASSGATSYNVERSSSSSGPYSQIASGIAATNYTDTGLAGGTTYYYAVEAVNACGASAYSAYRGATTIPSAPTGLAALVGNAQVTLSWTASFGATSYNVYRSTTNGGPYTQIASGQTGTAYTDSGLNNGTTYYYVVTAVGTSGESSNSSQFGATPASSGGVLFVRACQNLVSATSVSASMADNAGDAILVAVREGSSGSGITGGMVTDTVGNTYKLVATASQGTARASGFFLATNVVASGNNTITFNWGTSTTVGIVAEEFANVARVEVFTTATTTNTPVTSLSSGSITTTNNGDLLAFEVDAAADETWTAGSGYTIPLNGSNSRLAMECFVTGAAGGYSTLISDSAAASLDGVYVALTSSTNASGPPPAPTGLMATPGNAQVTLSWNASTGATSYKVKSSTTNGGPYTVIATNITTTGYTNTGLINGTTYYYVVTAVNGSGESGYSNQAGATPCVTPGVPTGLSATGGNAQVTLSWTASTNATSYTVKSSTTNGGPYAVIATNITTTGYTNTGLANGTTYYYVVDAVNACGSSGDSAQASAATIPAAPAGLSATPGNAQVTLSWNASTGATSYKVKSSTTNGGPYTVIATNITTTGYTNTGLINGTTYYYVVSAVNGSGESVNSSQVSATPASGSPPPAPTGLAATNGNARVILGWKASTNATSYNVKSSTTNGGPYTTITNVTTTGYTNTGLANGTNYYYVVSALNGGGESANSSQVSATPRSWTLIEYNGEGSGTWGGVSTTGAWTTSTNEPGYYGTNYWHDNNAESGHTARYTPNISYVGYYNVYAWWPAASTNASNTTITVTYGGGTTNLTVSQQVNGGTWNLLGTYYLPYGTTCYATISDTGANGDVIANAVKYDLY